ncbi:NADPH-dependent FMN reductase [Pseudoalteromonas sp. YIC-827]|uniref:NADPH-dependent FMN reductase n=1 Tax=Pseudoalteromonas qingdaonensis TaxID=3131913 RepID=A0ABU9MYS0_9GAMM
MNILLMSGSFHSKSKSIAVLKMIQEYFPSDNFHFPKLDDLPFYSEDLAVNKPDSILRLLDQVGECEGIIVCSPEYNHSVPAVLKNAIDWVSRPAFNSVLKDKPVTIITQANSPVGGARA